MADGCGSPTDEILRDERDPYVRELFRFRRDGKGRLAKAFRYADCALQSNRLPKAGTLIKAMSIAGFTVSEIARHLSTETKNVAAFLKIYFDIERYRGNRVWLSSIVFGGENRDGMTEIQPEGAELLATAFVQGKAGLMHVLDGGGVLAPELRAELHGRICSAVTQRAHAFVARLGAQSIPPGDADFERFLRVAEGARLEAQDNQRAREEALRDGLIEALHRKAVQNPENPKLQEFVKNHPLPDTAAAETRAA